MKRKPGAKPPPDTDTDEGYVTKTVRLSPMLWADVQSCMQDRGGIDFTAFARMAFSNEIWKCRVERELARAQVAEAAAVYRHSSAGPIAPGAPPAAPPKAS